MLVICVTCEQTTALAARAEEFNFDPRLPYSFGGYVPVCGENSQGSIADPRGEVLPVLGPPEAKYLGGVVLDRDSRLESGHDDGGSCKGKKGRLCFFYVRPKKVRVVWDDGPSSVNRNTSPRRNCPLRV